MEKAKRFLTFYRKSINPPYVAKDLIVFILTIGAPILILIAVVFTISHTKQSEVRAAAPPKDISYNVGVLVVRYFPTNDGVYLDTSVTGSDTPAGTTVAQIRSKVNRMNSETLTGLTDGSKYHGYKDPNATAALNYYVVDDIEFLTQVPSSNTGDARFVDHNKIPLDLCNYVESRGVNEIWVWMYHSNYAIPVESHLSGPNGNIGNGGNPINYPKCAKSVTTYDYNFGRETDEALHNHGHQIEIIMKRYGDPTFENKFIGPFSTYSSNDGGGSNFHRCGWTHTPPNTSGDYDYANKRYSWTDCEDWVPDGTGEKVYINCDRWNCRHKDFHVWRWQNMPGKNNPLPDASNWWDFIGDYDKAISLGEKLFYDARPPTVPTNLFSTNVYYSQATINWSASTDDFRVSYYNIKRDGVIIGSSPDTSFTDFNLSANTTYQYTISAIDFSNNVSVDSMPLSVVTNNNPPLPVERPYLSSTTYYIGGSDVGSYTWNHTVGSGPNSLLLVNVSIREDSRTASVVSVLANNKPLSLVGVSDQGGLRVEVWSLLSPSPGVHDMKVTFSSPPVGSVSGATTWYQVNQSDPFGNFAKSTGFSANPSLNMTSASDQVIVDILAMPNLSTDIISPGSGQILLWNQWSSGDTRSGASYKNGTSSTTMVWNTKNEAWALAAVSIKLAPQDNQPPTVSISSPSNSATVTGTTTISANASDNIGVAKVEFYVDNSLKSTDTTSPYSYNWDTAPFINGNYSLLAKAYDATGNVGASSPVSVTVANPPPCDLTSASWSRTTANEGEVVNLVVNGSSGCDGKEVRFEVKENDSVLEGIGDDPVSTNPATVKFSGTTANGIWKAEWQNDCFGLCLPPEYYFNATLVGDSSKTLRSLDPLLEVFQGGAGGQLENPDHPDGTLIGWPQNRVLLLEDGKKSHVLNVAVMKSHGYSFEKVKEATTNDLSIVDATALNLREGTLVVGSNNKVYIIDYESGNIRKRHITSSSVMLGLGFKFEEVLKVSDPQLPATDGPSVSSTAIHPDGVLVIDATGKVYRIESGTKRHVKSRQVLTSHGYTYAAVRKAALQDLTLPNGSPLDFREGTLIRGSDGKVYAVDYDAGTIRKRHITSRVIYLQLGYKIINGVYVDVISVNDSQIPAADEPAIQ